MPTKINWTEETWNVSTGCTKVSPGCDHCYAAPMAKRLQAMGQAKYANGFRFTPHPSTLNIPYGWKKPREIFVNSMSDAFHKNMPIGFLKDIFDVMLNTPRHTYQVLTKRSDLMAALSPQLPWPGNVWAGVTIENNPYVHRADHLRQVPAKVRFLSLEPLLGPLPDLNLDGIHWVIVGGESGPGFRTMDPDWVRDIRDRCVAADIPFFFKQWSGRSPKKLGREIDGRVWSQKPQFVVQ